MQVRCLHCQEPVELSDESDFSSLTCPSCGSNFSLVGDRTVSYKAAKARSIGHFELIDQVGIGAFGSVWKARDKELERRVAVKIPRKGELDAEEAEQFLREARAAAQLRHPHIVGVHEVGREDDSVYIVSDFVEGATLDDWLTGQQVSNREAAELVAKIAEALHHAHEAGVIHRDLKPGNIMMDLDGEPHLLDFGLARRTAGEVTMTIEGRVLGTPAYMSPEQARGEGHQADRRSDIYSAGVVLFKLLTGELPFRGNPQMLIVQIQREEPPSPRKLNSRVPRDLETICLKCLEKKPDGRYATAAELAAELRRWLSGEPIEARPIGAAARGWRWCLRNPVVAGLSATAAMLLVAVAAVASAGYFREAGLRETADRERVAAQEARDAESMQRKKSQALAEENKELADVERQSKEEYRRQLYFSDMNLVAQAYAEGSISRMKELLEKHRPQPGAAEEDLRGFEWYHWWRAGHLYKEWIRNPVTATFRRLAVSPDGKTVAVSGFPNSIYLCDSTAVRLQRSPLVTQSEWTSLSFSPDGTLLAAGNRQGGGRIRVWTTADWELVGFLNAGAAPGEWGPVPPSVAFSPTQPILATGGRGAPIILWSTCTWKRLATMPANGNIQSLAFAPGGMLLVAGLEDGTLVVCDVPKRKIVRTLSAHQQSITSVAYSPDGSLLATGSEDEIVRLWNEQLEPTGTLPAQAPVNSLAFSPDGKLLVAGTSKSNSLLVWNMETPAYDLKATIKAHARQVDAVAFVGDSKTVWSASEDGFVKVWDLSQCEPFDTLRDVSDEAHVAYASEGQTLLVRDAQGTVKRWDITARKFLPPLGLGEPYSHVAVSDDGAVLAGVTGDGQIRVSDLTRGELLGEQSVSLQAGARLAVARDGQTVAWTVTERQRNSEQLFVRVDVHNVQTGSTTHLPKQPLYYRSSLVFSPDGRRLAVQIWATTAIWDVTTDPPTLQHELSGWGPEMCAAFSPDGTILAVGSFNNDIRLYEAAAGELKYILKGHTQAVETLAFSRDGRRLVSGSADGTVRIWQVARHQGRLASTLRGHSDTVNSVAFSPRGDSVASAADDGTIKVWRTATPQEAEPDIEDWVLRSIAYTAGQQWDQALQEVTEAIERFGANHQALAIRGDVYFQRKDWTAAIADFTKALSIIPGDVPALEKRAECYFQLGRWRQSADDWSRLIQLTPTPNFTASSFQEFNDEIKRFWIELRPLNVAPKVHYLLRRGECFARRGNRAGAKADFITILRQCRGDRDRSYSRAVARDLARHPIQVSLERMRHRLALARALVPTAAVWHYTTDPPSKDWKDTNASDHTAWQTGRAPFGTYLSDTRWNSSDIWLRHAFELEQDVEEPLVFSVFVGETGYAADTVEIYLNGVRAASTCWRGPRYQLVYCSKNAKLRRGSNVLAVHAVNPNQDARVDVGLYVRGDDDVFRELLAEAIKELPDSELLLRRSRAEWYVEREMWQEAAADLTTAVVISPDAVGELTGVLQLPATRACVLTSETRPAVWRYRFSKPAEGWQNDDFDATSWETGVAPFGDRGNPNTRWSSTEPDIWLRREFALSKPPDAPLVFRAIIDEEAEIYLNGVLAASGTWVDSHRHLQYQRLACTEAATRTLRSGKNVLAVHCRNIDRAGFIDVGLYGVDPAAQDKVLGILSKALEAHPKNSALLTRRGEAYAHRGMWQEAAADFQRIVELDPQDGMNWLRAAVLLALAGSEDNYRQLVRKMASQFAGDDGLAVNQLVAKAGLLLPDVVPTSQLPLGKFTAALDDGSAPAEFRPWGFSTRALAAYRDGDFQQALNWVPKTQKAQGPPRCRAFCLVIRALAEHKLDSAAEARQTLSEQVGLIDARLPLINSGAMTTGWESWLIAEILRREAAALINGESQK